MSKWKDLVNKLEGVDESGEFKGLTIGVKPIRIIEVIDNDEKEYLEILFDIAAGPEKDFFTNKSVNSTWDFNAKFYRSYKDSALSFFKSFITAVEKSNEGYSFAKTEGDVSKLVGKVLYATFENHEIPTVDDEGKPRVVVKINSNKLRSMEAFKEGKIKEPLETDIVKMTSDYDLNKFKENYNEWVKENKPKETPVTKTETIISDDLPF